MTLIAFLVLMRRPIKWQCMFFDPGPYLCLLFLSTITDGGNFFFNIRNTILHLVSEFEIATPGSLPHSRHISTKLKVDITFMVYLILLYLFLLCMHRYFYSQHHRNYSAITKYMLTIQLTSICVQALRKKHLSSQTNL